MIDYKQMFINLLSVLHIDRYVNKDRTTNQARTRRDREEEQEHRTSKRSPVQAGIDRCAIRQEEHRRTDSVSIQSLFRQLHEKGSHGKHGKGKGSTQEHDARRKGSIEEAEGTRIKGTRSIIPSFLFSYNFFLLIQSIDDICMQINPLLIGALLH